MSEITIKDIKFSNIPNKKLGTGLSTTLTLTNIGTTQTVSDYIASDKFYKLVNAIDINWNGILIGEVTINDTADLINWINSSAGKSAYEVYVSTVENPLSVEQWLASLVGPKGDPGEVNADNFYTKEEIDKKILNTGNPIDLSEYAKTEDIPTKTSELTNDSNYITSHLDISGKANTEDVYTKVLADARFLTEHQSLSNYVTNEKLNEKFDDLLGVNADDIETLANILNDEDTTTGILKEISSKVNNEDLSEIAFSGDYDDLEEKPFGEIDTTPIVLAEFNNVKFNYSPNSFLYYLEGNSLYSIIIYRYINQTNNVTLIYDGKRYIGNIYMYMNLYYINVDPVENKVPYNDTWSIQLDTSGSITIVIHSENEEDALINHSAKIILNTNKPSLKQIENKYINLNSIISDRTIKDKPFGDTYKNVYNGNIIYENDSSLFLLTGPAHFGNNIHIESEFNTGDIIEVIVNNESLGTGEVTKSNTDVFEILVGEPYSDNYATYPDKWFIRQSTSSTFIVGICDVSLAGTTGALKIKKVTSISTVEDTITIDKKYLPASDKPTYDYLELNYTTLISTGSGDISIDGTKSLHTITASGDITSLTLLNHPNPGHSTHVIISSADSHSIHIKHDNVTSVCPLAKDLDLTIPAGGYVEVDFLYDGNRIYVRGV